MTTAAITYETKIIGPDGQEVVPAPVIPRTPSSSPQQWRWGLWRARAWRMPVERGITGHSGSGDGRAGLRCRQR